MKYFSLLIVFLLNLPTVQAQEYENDSILIWNQKRKLTWDDFQSEKTEQNYFDAAGVSSGIEFLPRRISVENIEEIKIFAIVLKNKSWVSNPSEKLLDHEQTHFNITELYARKIRCEIKNYINKNDEYELETIRDLYYKFQDELDSVQDIYDQEIRKDWNNGRFYQKKWDRKTDSLLQVYKDYERDYTIEGLEEKE